VAGPVGAPLKPEVGPTCQRVRFRYASISSTCGAAKRAQATRRCCACALAAAWRRRRCPRCSGRALLGPPHPQPVPLLPPPPALCKSSPPSAKVAPLLPVISGIPLNDCRQPSRVPPSSLSLVVHPRQLLPSYLIPAWLLARRCACWEQKAMASCLLKCPTDACFAFHVDAGPNCL
jgi:hypothetical protein